MITYEDEDLFDPKILVYSNFKKNTRNNSYVKNLNDEL